MPSTRARGVSSSMIQALEARRRSTSQTRPGDRGTIAGAGIAMRGAPLLQRLRGRHALGVDGVDQFDGGGEPRSGSH